MVSAPARVAPGRSNAIALAEFGGDLDASQHEAVRSLFTPIFKTGSWLPPIFSGGAALDRTAELSRTHTAKLGTRALDVLHVASALELGARTFVSYDTRQAALAKAVGLKTLAP